MKSLLPLSLALLTATPVLSQDYSGSVSTGPINAGQVISILISGTTGTNGAMAARVQVGGNYRFEQLGNAAPVETVSAFAPNIMFAKNGDASGGVSVTQALPNRSFNAQVGTPQLAAPAFAVSSFQPTSFAMPAFQVSSFQATSFGGPSFFSAPRGFFGN
jgi:hypothetical protein